MADPSLDTEAIYDAFFRLVSSVPDFKTASRRLRMWNEVDAQPALFQNQLREEEVGSPKSPTMVTLFLDLYVYARTDPDDAPTSTKLNVLIKAIRDALAPDPVTGDGRQTLGGLCYHARVNGTILIDEGVQDGQAIARIPCEITANVGV